MLRVVDITHWSYEEIERTPAIVIDRLLQLAEARDLAIAEVRSRH